MPKARARFTICSPRTVCVLKFDKAKHLKKRIYVEVIYVFFPVRISVVSENERIRFLNTRVNSNVLIDRGTFYEKY